MFFHVRPLVVLFWSASAAAVGWFLIKESYHQQILAMGISGGFLLIPAACVFFSMCRHIGRFLTDFFR